MLRRFAVCSALLWAGVVAIGTEVQEASGDAERGIPSKAKTDPLPVKGQQVARDDADDKAQTDPEGGAAKDDTEQGAGDRVIPHADSKGRAERKKRGHTRFVLLQIARLMKSAEYETLAKEDSSLVEARTIVHKAMQERIRKVEKKVSQSARRLVREAQKKQTGRHRVFEDIRNRNHPVLKALAKRARENHNENAAPTE